MAYVRNISNVNQNTERIRAANNNNNNTFLEAFFNKILFTTSIIDDSNEVIYQGT